jgi:hypothetical protein
MVFELRKITDFIAFYPISAGQGISFVGIDQYVVIDDLQCSFGLSRVYEIHMR